MTYYCLKGLEWLGLVWDIRGVPEYVREGKTKWDSDRNVLKQKIGAAAKAAELPTTQPELELTAR
jgi:stearoyl-CoA desaturase (delta-9 desaturase)